MKAGSTVPVKWRITDANGVGVSGPASFTNLRLVNAQCPVAVPMQTVDEEITAGTGLKYHG